MEYVNLYHCKACLERCGLQVSLHPLEIARCTMCHAQTYCSPGRKKIVDFKKFFDTAEPKKVNRTKVRR